MTKTFVAGFFGVLLAASTAMASVVTVTSPSGTFTNPGPTNASGPGIGYDTWFANNVRAGGSAGISAMYPDSGNGSILFSGPTGAKADFEYYFSTPNQFALADVTAFSYDVYRSSSSTAAARYEPALRLYVSDGTHTGYLVFEGVYNGQAVSPVDTFTNVNVQPAYVWSTGTLPDPASNYTRTIADWVALLPGLKVLGLSTGIGSGWDGSFVGAVDNITIGTARGSITYNFETAAAAAVPEPASLGLLALGLAGLGVVRRRKA